MTLRFDINSGEFIDVGLPGDGNIVELIASNTIHNGIGAPSNEIGIDGDFYIDTQAMNFYGPKEIEWGACVCLLGKDGLPGRDGKDGLNGVDGINGIDGKDGRDGKDGIAGRDGISPPPVELRTTPTHVQFRYGVGEWADLFTIPKNKTLLSGGGGKTMANIQAAIDATIANLGDLAFLDIVNLATQVTGILSPANGGENRNIVTTTSATYNATSANRTILCNAASNAITVNLPAAASNNELTLDIKKIDSSSNKVTIDANSTEVIDGTTTKTISTQWTSYTVKCNGTAWYVL